MTAQDRWLLPGPQFAQVLAPAPDYDGRVASSPVPRHGSTPSRLARAKHVLSTACGLVLLVASSAGQDEPAKPKPRRSASGVGLEEGGLEPLTELETVGSGEIQEALTAELARADHERWLEETLVTELSAGTLLDLKRLLLGPWSQASREPALSSVFTADARVGSLVPTGFVEEPVTIGVVRRVWKLAEGEAARGSDPEAWLAGLRALHAQTKRVRWVRLKLAALERTAYGLHVELKLTLNRELPSGALQHDTGVWNSEWVQNDAGGWRCRRLEHWKSHETLLSEAPHFVDATETAFAGTGLDPRLPKAKSGMYRGLALADLDGDADLDLVTTMPTRILANRGDGSFEDRTASALPTRNAFEAHFSGVLVADFDRDGAQDIVLSGNRRPSLLLLQREGRFLRKPIAASHADNIATSLAAHDVDGDGWLDLFLCGYGPFVQPGPNDFTSATNGQPNQLLRGLPGGEFEDVLDLRGRLRRPGRRRRPRSLRRQRFRSERALSARRRSVTALRGRARGPRAHRRGLLDERHVGRPRRRPRPGPLRLEHVLERGRAHPPPDLGREGDRAGLGPGRHAALDVEGQHAARERGRRAERSRPGAGREGRALGLGHGALRLRLRRRS
jgi:hypothetical protein